MTSPSFKGRNIISIMNLMREEIDHILNVSSKMEEFSKNSSEILKGKILTTAFFEPSTRTKLSFESAMLRLGGHVIGFSDPQKASVAKGECLADTIRTIANYSDIIVLRHPKEGSAKLAAEISPIPIINAGSGQQEHPTQALLDLYTIRSELGRIDSLKIAMLGDLKYGRTTHSLAYALAKYPNIELFLVSHPMLRMQKEVSETLKENGIKVEELETIDSIIEEIDVLYVTRVQEERFVDLAEFEKVKGTYMLDSRLIEKTKDKMIIMHPLPRLDEIQFDVDKTPKAVYFKQAKNGLLVRMALLSLLLTDKPA
ncbi:MAG: aspartate carbamoyltransferase [Asgard group archaeon]